MALAKARKVGRKFQAPVPTKVGGFSTVVKLLPQLLRGREEREPKVTVGPFLTDVEVYSQPPESGLRVTWFGHASLLVEIDGVRVLVDPVWDKRASPTSFLGPKRFFRATMRVAEMPRVDAVLITHDHYDHLGKWTVRALVKQMPDVRWVTGLGVGKVLEGFGVQKQHITELDWMDATTLRGEGGAELEVTAVPARHFSGRSLGNRNQTLWVEGAALFLCCWPGGVRRLGRRSAGAGSAPGGGPSGRRCC